MFSISHVSTIHILNFKKHINIVVLYHPTEPSDKVQTKASLATEVFMPSLVHSASLSVNPQTK